ncbi:MAG: crossover junction endodeoxyribonuclease RuvC [Paracoccaceae bacterium]
MRVIGLDPGLRRTGWGVVESAGGRVRAVAHGAVGSGEGSLAARLARLYDALEAVISDHAPEAAAVEQTFVSRDAAGTLKLGQARAVALLVPARAGLPVAEYAPNAVKKAVVGVGHADKAQIQHMIARLLPGAGAPGADAADALAVALCHAWTAGTDARRQAALARSGRG